MIFRIQVQNKNEKYLEYVLDRLKGTNYQIVEGITKVGTQFKCIKVIFSQHRILNFNQTIGLWMTIDLIASTDTEWVYRLIADEKIL